MADLRQADERARETTDTGEMAIERRQLRRRGLIAGAAALAAGVLATRTADSVSAAYNVQGDASNTAGATTTLSAASPLASAPILRLANGFGSTGYSGTFDNLASGVQGYAVNNSVPGVFGRNNDPGGLGVQGVAPLGTAVYGYSGGNGNGVVGISSSGSGVYGFSTSNNSIYGVSNGQSLAGVLGQGNGTNTYGVWGYATGTGSYAGVFTGNVSVNAATGHALASYANQANAAGVLGIGNAATTIGVYGLQSAGIYAGYFAGKVVVGGDFAVTGSKSAAVPHPDGTHRLLYCMEAPEAWFEDFGEGTVANGKASVALDPDFAALVETTRYYVFLTEQGDHNALFVANRTATGFEVHAKGGPTASGAFHYRVVAKRKDIAAPRLAKVDVADPVKALPAPPPPKVDVSRLVPPRS